MNSQNETPIVVFRHYKNVKKSGYQMLAITFLAAVIIGVPGYFWIHDLWVQGEKLPYRVIGAAVALFLFCIAYAMSNILSVGHFIFQIDSEKIMSVSPVKWLAPSFVMPLDELAKIETEKSKPSASEGAYYLHDASGGRFHISPHYGNPVKEILETLRELELSIEEITTIS